MGIIIRQSVKSAIWSYLGIVVGYINVGIIMPQFFDTAQIGLVQIFIAVSLIFSQFATLGFTSVINRMFPIFRDPKKGHNGFLFLAIATGIIGFGVSVAGFFLLKPWIIETNIEKSPLLVDYLFLLLPLVLMRLMFTLLDNYNKVLLDAVTGTFWMEFMHKVVNLLLIAVFALGWINFRQFFFGYLLSMSMPVLPVILVLFRRKNFNLRPDFHFLEKPVRRELSWVMFFGFINGFAVVVIQNIDKVFVNQYLSLDEVGIFGVCALFATLIKVPYNSISKIAIGIIAEAWKRNDTKLIQEIYQKSAINQAVIGTLIFVGIVANLHNIFEILPSEYANGKWVIIIYAIGTLFNTTLGLAGNITETSRYFRVNTLFVGMIMICQIGLSVLLIGPFGITGAALATTLTLSLGAGMQIVFHWITFRISGLDKRLFLVAAVGAFCYGITYFIPNLPLIPDIIIRNGILITVYSGLVLYFRISADLNNLARNFIIRLFFRK